MGFGLSKPTVAQCAEQVLEAVSRWQIFAGETGVSGEQKLVSLPGAIKQVC
jgi:hypothetical protein